MHQQHQLAISSIGVGKAESRQNGVGGGTRAGGEAGEWPGVIMGREHLLHLLLHLHKNQD